jgi:hypothetical protein
MLHGVTFRMIVLFVHIHVSTGPACVSKIAFHSDHVPIALFSLAELYGYNTDELFRVLYTY